MLELRRGYVIELGEFYFESIVRICFQHGAPSPFLRWGMIWRSGTAEHMRENCEIVQSATLGCRTLLLIRIV